MLYDVSTVLSIPRTTLMQWTGLIDKNDQEVDDQDVVSHGFHNFLLTWDDKQARFIRKLLSERSIGGAYWYVMENIYTYEVVGNVFENQELVILATAAAA